ncbi:MAG: LysR family transcriptional regulator [Parvibaculaceae bacterium]
MPLARDSQIGPSDIKLLRIFRKVVECGGFVGAQAELNIGASTISTHMAALETRLGMRLCERGRVGFRVTEKGRQVYAAALRLDEAIDSFRTDVGALKGKLVGELHIGIVDSTVTNVNCQLEDALARFTQRDNAVHITLHIADPVSIEKRVQENQLSLGIAAFHHHVPGLEYQYLFSEEHGLYCGSRSRFFGKAPGEVAREELFAADYVSHGHLPSRQTFPKPGVKIAATAYDMEATLTMIRSGAFIGYLPVHYASQWVERGILRRLLPAQFSFHTEFEVATRRGLGDLRIVMAFLEDLRAAHQSEAFCDAAKSPRGTREELVRALLGPSRAPAKRRSRLRATASVHRPSN